MPLLLLLHMSCPASKTSIAMNSTPAERVFALRQKPCDLIIGTRSETILAWNRFHFLPLPPFPRETRNFSVTPSANGNTSFD